MTRLTFACPETGKPLTAMTVVDRDASIRLVVHCPKCSQLHEFANGDAVEQQEVALT
jgi:transcription elongation factor Elf1